MERKALLLLLTCILCAWPGQTTQNPLTGTYSADILTDVLPKNLQGKWTLVFSPENQYSVLRDTVIMVNGHYETRGDTLILIDRLGKLACPEEQNEGLYQFRIDSETVRFIRLEDFCRGRSAIITAKPYRIMKK